MAATGPLADFARMPTQRKALVFVIAGVLLGGLYFQFILKPLRSDVEEAEANHQQLLGKSAQLDADMPKYEALKAHMTELKAIIEENQKALPTEAEVPAFFETLEHKVTEAGVEINKWEKKPEEPVETFVKVPVEVQLTGTFMQIKRFFASLVQKDVAPRTGDPMQPVEERERVVSIENLTLTQPVVKNREIILSAKFTAVTFRQEDKAAPAPGAAPVAPAKATGSGAAPGTGAGSAKSNAPPTPPMPPMPSPATPAGAKARVESSLEKGDVRNRGAAAVDDKSAGSASTGSAGAAKLKGGI